MIQSRKFGPESRKAQYGDKRAVKLEMAEDSLEKEGDEPEAKRSKQTQALLQQGKSGNDLSAVPESQYDLFSEPSPLGLRLRKSPSLLDLIQTHLSKSSSANLGAEHNQELSLRVKKESKVISASAASHDKLKASNFLASIVRIGSWEYSSRYEGDLVAKCYFAKHKLVWEVLQSGLKSKIEIQWSDITALNASFPDDGPGTLNIVLARPPLFFRETNPQPRKHTLWQATADFTNGQASMHRQHFMQSPQGQLDKHFEKLIQCDLRLNFLSQQPEIILDSPYFEPRASVFENPHGSEGLELSQLKFFKGASFFPFQDLASPSGPPSSSVEMERKDHPGLILEHMSREAPSPSSGSENCEVVDSLGPRIWNEITVTGLNRSMSVSDLVNRIGHCISEQTGDETEYEGMLEDIAQHLLSDTPSITPSDEKCLMSRVNSLCCLLQKDPPLEQSGESSNEESGEKKPDAEMNHGEVTSSSGMSRKDSFGDLLNHLPRIASLPKLLYLTSQKKVV